MSCTVLTPLSMKLLNYKLKFQLFVIVWWDSIRNFCSICNYSQEEWELEIQDEFDRKWMDQIWLSLAWYNNRYTAKRWGWLQLVAADWLASSEHDWNLPPYQTQPIPSSWSSAIWSLQRQSLNNSGCTYVSMQPS